MVGRVLLDGWSGVTRVFRMVARRVLWWILVSCKVVTRVFCVAARKLLCGCWGEKNIFFLKRTQ